MFESQSFVLVDQTPQPDKNFESFVKRIVRSNLLKQTISVSLKSDQDSALSTTCVQDSGNNSNPTEPTLVSYPFPICLICQTEYADGQLNKFRQCRVSVSSPCSSSCCSCPPFRVCTLCYFNLLWKNTNDFMKKQVRYRAKCPFCKAEFCDLDLVVNVPHLEKPALKVDRKQQVSLQIDEISCKLAEGCQQDFTFQTSYESVTRKVKCPKTKEVNPANNENQQTRSQSRTDSKKRRSKTNKKQ
eukprot:TRINITY_DN5179_c0_g1_i1.p1 TRINITY_DN5179_c0_g1~~TRINITY_DN5179_c0_g1_i1.p1  ORF type:complete len:243 (-),score=43.28 TRINITY_DN5179_c0_g1_i1:203-931(-)